MICSHGFRHGFSSHLHECRSWGEGAESRRWSWPLTPWRRRVATWFFRRSKVENPWGKSWKPSGNPWGTSWNSSEIQKHPWTSRNNQDMGRWKIPRKYGLLNELFIWTELTLLAFISSRNIWRFFGWVSADFSIARLLALITGQPKEYNSGGSSSPKFGSLVFSNNLSVQ